MGYIGIICPSFPSLKRTSGLLVLPPKAKMLFHLQEKETVQQYVREQIKILSQASRLETSYYDLIIKVNGIDEHTLINQQKHLLCLKCHLFCTALQLSIRNDEWLGLG
jgi:hypothetical protein